MHRCFCLGHIRQAVLVAVYLAQQANHEEMSLTGGVCLFRPLEQYETVHIQRAIVISESGSGLLSTVSLMYEK